MTDVAWYEPTQLWVAVGHQVSSGAIWVSPDGARWRQVATLDPHPAGGIEIQAVVSTDSGLVAVGRDWLDEGHSVPASWTSPDGETWSRSEVQQTAEAGEAAMVDVARTGSGLVAVGFDHRAPAVWSSPHGRTWTPIGTGDTFGPDVSLTAVASDTDRLVAVGHADAEDVDARAWTSTDGGRSWRGIEVETGPVGLPSLYDVAVTPHGWIAVGADGSTLRPDTIAAVWSSNDGVEWHRHEPRGPQLRPQDRAVGVVMRAVAFRDGTFAAVGYQGQQCASRHSRCELDTAAWVSNRLTPSR